MNSLYSLYYYYLRKIEPGFHVTKDELVVDIGSGDKPFWRADLYVDDLSLGNEQRFTDTKTVNSIGKFVNAKAEKLPFKNKAFDFAFTSHLLEHVDNPAAVIDELTRVAKRGYVEVPNGIMETIQPFYSHLWFVFRNGDKLIFVRKNKQMQNILLQNGKKYMSLMGMSKDPFIRLYWKDKINYQVIDDIPKNQKYQSQTPEEKTTHNSYGWQMYLVKLLRLIFYKHKSLDRMISKK